MLLAFYISASHGINAGLITAALFSKVVDDVLIESETHGPLERNMRSFPRLLKPFVRSGRNVAVIDCPILYLCQTAHCGLAQLWRVGWIHFELHHICAFLHHTSQ